MSAVSEASARRIDRRCFWFLLALLFALPLPLGANRAWLWPLFAAATFALSAVILLRIGLGRSRPRPALRAAGPALLLLALWVAVGAVQLLPLPGLAGPAGTLSVEPGVSAATLLQTLFFIALFVLTLQLTASRHRLRALLATFVVAGLVQAAYGSLMTLSGVEYGAFGPKEHGLGLATGTFVNRNHLAGFLELCLAAGLGLLVAQLDDGGEGPGLRIRLRTFLRSLLGPKMLVRLSLAVMVIGLVLTRSRMGNAAFFVSLLLSATLALTLIRRPPRTLVLLFLSLLAVDLLILGTWFGAEQIVERLQATGQAIGRGLDEDQSVADTAAAGVKRQDSDRLAVSRAILNAWKEYRWLGSGGGTFYAVFPAYRPDGERHFFDHAHNDHLEFLLEYGALGIAPLAAFALLTLLHALRGLRRRDQLARGGAFATLLGWLALALHGSVDFNLHIPANGAYLMVLLAVTWVAATLPAARSPAAPVRA